VSWEQIVFVSGGAVVGGAWLVRRIRRSLWKTCPACRGTNRGGKGLFGAYDHCGKCDGGEVPSAIGRFFGVGR